MAQTKIPASMITGLDALLADTKWSVADVASAGTCDIGAATTPRVNITGTTTITSLGTDVNTFRIVRFAGALTLTHNATTLILPGGANITTEAGDHALFGSDGSGNWTCISYIRDSGFPLYDDDIGSTVQAYDADTAKLDANQEWSAPQRPEALALTSATGWDGTAKQYLTVTVDGGAFTIANPSSATTNAFYVFKVSYTTSHSISWGANYKGVSGITPTATAGGIDYFTFQWDGTNMNLVGYSLDAGA
jgi:hypothetical protein